MRNRYRTLYIVFGFALACVTGLALVLLVVNGTPRLMVVLLGLEPAGGLEDALPADPDPLALEGSHVDHIDLLLPPHLTEPLRLTPEDLGSAMFLGDATKPGVSSYLFSFDEASLGDFLQHRVLPEEGLGGRYRNLSLDLQPGGLILYADVDLGLRWQRMGLLLLQDRGAEERVAFASAGVVLDQAFYRLPETGFLARASNRASSYVARMLAALTVAGPLPGEARVVQTRCHADRLEILARANYDAESLADTGWRVLEPGVELRELDALPDAQRPADRLRIVRFDPAQVRFRVRYDPAEPRLVSEWAAQLQPLLVVNAAYFAPEDEGGEAIGLLVSEGERQGTSLGTFAGMFAVASDGAVDVRWLRDQPYDPTESLAEAVQSFPVLIKPGGAMGFPADGDDGAAARRTVVAQDRSGDILFIVAPRGYFSLHELAVFLANADLDIDVALNLDGGSSTGLWLQGDGVSVEIDSFTPVPSVITVERR